MEQEIWKAVIGFEGLYEISNYGNFKRLPGYKLNCWKQRVIRLESYPKPSAKTSDTMYLYKDGEGLEKQTKKAYKIDELLLKHFDIREINYKINPVVDLTGEIWKVINGYPDYEISNKGRVKALSKVRNSIHGTRTTREKIITQHYNKLLGYIYVNMYQKGMPTSRSLHRIIAINWIPNPENKREVNHIDGNKQNNSIENLEWMSSLENTRHSFTTNSKKSLVLNIEKAEEIREMHKMGMTNSQIALVLGIQRKMAWRVVTNQSWTF